jgi:WD40 repeat protein
MSDVFVSYSRRDSEFVRRLADSVSERGKDVWLDTEGIADADVFPEAIKRAIEGSDAFVFVITPSSVESAYCENEVEYARDLQKRIVPVLRDPVPDPELPVEIRDRNWIPFTEDGEFDTGLSRLLNALDTDLEAARAHTRWLVKALEWDSEGRDKSFLLRGSELKAAEAWLASRPEDADPAPTPLQREYLLASREAAARRQRALMGGVGVVAVVSIGLLIFALISRGQAVSERTSARAQALAAESQAELANDPEISLILGMRAVRTKATPQTLFALRAALDASPLELALPTADVPASCSQNLGGGLTAAYSPDGRQIAEAICTGEVRLVNAADGRLERRVSAGARGASGIAYSPDGSALAVGTGPGVVLLDPHTGKLLRRLSGVRSPHPAQTLAVAFSPNRRMLAATSPGGLTVWTLPAGRARMLAVTPAQGFNLAFSPDGRRLYTGGMDDLVRVYDVASGRPLHQIDPFPRNHGQSWPLLVAVSHDGSRLAIGYPGGVSGSGTVSIFSARNWRKEFDIVSIPEVEIQSVAFSPDDTRLAVGAYDGTSGVWSLTAREQLAAYDGPTASVNSVSFTPDGRSVLTASSDGIARVWRGLGVERSFRPIGGNLNFVVLRGSTLSGVVQGPNGSQVSRWRLPGGQLLSTHTLVPTANGGFVNLSADGRYAFVARFRSPPSASQAPLPAALTIVDAATGHVVRRLGSTTLNLQGAPMFSPDDSRLILSETPSAKIIPGPGGVGTGINGTPRVVVLDLATGHTVNLSPAAPCGPGVSEQWAFSGDGRRIAQESFCGVVEVWDARTGARIQTVDQNAETSAVALNHDGSRLLVASWDSRAAIYSVVTGRRVVSFVGHTRGIADAALSPDGTRVVTDSLDHTVRVWDARSGQNLRVLTFADTQAGVSFSADGSELAVGENTPTFGAPAIVRVFGTCPACQNPGELLKLAAPHATSNTTQLERSVLSGS